MRFDLISPITGGASADADPRATPASVPPNRVFEIPASLRRADDVPQRLVFALEGTSAQTAVIEVWVLDQTAPAGALVGDQMPAATDLWYKATGGTAITLTVGKLTAMVAASDGSVVIPPRGKVYVRVTTAPAADAVLKAAAA